MFAPILPNPRYIAGVVYFSALCEQP